MKRLLAGWKQLRSHKALSLAIDVALILLVFLAVHAWQTRELPLDEPAPETVLRLLNSATRESAIVPGEVGVVYFFAPWCIYCKTSIDNLDELIEGERIAWGRAVALDYGDAQEVQDFVEETGVSLPVLMGNADTAADWSVRAFPTYYVIDTQGRIHSRSVGYSTWLGMWARTWMAGT